MLNFAGVIGLITFYWISSSPAQDLSPTKTAPDFTATSTVVIQSTTTPAMDIFGSIDTPIFPAFKSATTSTPTPEPTDDGKNPSVIGSSVAGRPLEVYRFGNGPTGRLIVAGIHGGNEYNTIKLANELIAHVESHPEIVPENITLYILPNLNPDGEARKHGVDGRVNDNGVDLNRNWPYRWEKDYDRSNCWHYRPTTAGDYAGSEPETAALIEFIESHPEIDALISYHSAALGIFAGGVPEYQPSIRLAKSLAKVSTYQYPPKDIGCVYTGNFTDWASSTREIAAVDIELHNFRYTDLDENLKIFNVFLKFKK